MITKVYQNNNFINIAVGCTDADGLRTNPTVATATFYRVSPLDGSLSAVIDEDLGTVTLVQIDTEVGFYGVSVDISDLTFGVNVAGNDVSSIVYTVLFELTIDGVNTITVDTIVVDKVALGRSI